MTDHDYIARYKLFMYDMSNPKETISLQSDYPHKLRHFGDLMYNERGYTGELVDRSLTTPDKVHLLKQWPRVHPSCPLCNPKRNENLSYG